MTERVLVIYKEYDEECTLVLCTENDEGSTSAQLIIRWKRSQKHSLKYKYELKSSSITVIYFRFLKYDPFGFLQLFYLVCVNIII